MRITLPRLGLACLAVLAAVFHLWNAEVMRIFSPTGTYFLTSGVLFLVGGIFVALWGTGFLFSLGAWGLVALSVIDNGLLYYTRTYGFGILSGLAFRARNLGGNFSRFNAGNFSRFAGGNFSRFNANSTFSRPGFNGPGALRPPLGGLRGAGGIGWSTSWIPPGAVQFFVLQSVIIVVALAVIFLALRSRSSELKSSVALNQVTGPSQSPPPQPSSNHSADEYAPTPRASVAGAGPPRP